jgi:post-segregation antitoxin (ccd killing protein)
VADTAPTDLIAVFRGLPRRLASVTADGHVLVAGDLATAARVLGVAPSSDPSETAATLASAIEARHADQWTNDDLAELRRLALTIGTTMRDNQE